MARSAPGAAREGVRRRTARQAPARVDGPRNVVRADLHRLRHTPVGPDDAESRLDLDLLERAAQQVPQLGRRGAACGQRPDDRQGVDALDQVVAGRLAELRLRGRQVEHVVDDLEDHAEGVAEGGQRLHIRPVKGRRRARRCAPAVENSDAVLPPIDSRYSASVRAAL